jgi:type IV pilus assembly protein PilV
VPVKRLGCWGIRAKQVIPELTDALITQQFSVGADAASGVVQVTVAWPVKKGQCLDGSDNEYCTFTLRSRL